MFNLGGKRSRHESDLSPRRSKCRARLLGAGLAAAGLFGGAATSLAGAGAAGAAEASNTVDTHVRGVVHLDAGVPAMTLTSITPVGSYTSIGQRPAERVAPGSTTSFVASAGSKQGTDVEFRYKIEGTNYAVRGKPWVPYSYLVRNQASCDILDATGNVVRDAPYFCTADIGRGRGPQADFYVKPAQGYPVQLEIHPWGETATFKKDGAPSCAWNIFQGTVRGVQTVQGFTARNDDPCRNSPTSVNWSVSMGGKLGFLSISQVAPKTYMVSCSGQITCSTKIVGAGSPIGIYFRPSDPRCAPGTPGC